MSGPSTSQAVLEWTSEELKILFHCINLRGAHEGSIDYISSRIETRSEAEIRDKISEIRELVKKKNERKLKEQEKNWCESEVPLSNDTKVQTWLDAVNHVQSYRKINDYTCQALTAYLCDEIERNSNTDSKQQLLCTDADGFLCSGRTEEVDVVKFYRFLRSAVNACRFKTDIRSLEAAVLLVLYQDIHREVDDIKLETKRRILRGMFRDIQDDEIADFDFRYCRGIDDPITVQLNPLNLTEQQLDVSGLLNIERSSGADGTH